MLNINKILIVTVTAVVFVKTTLCADFFESLLFRLDCYGDIQPGCNTELIDAYPDLRYGYLNLTEATTYFYLFTNEDPKTPELIHKCGGKLPPSTKFNPKCPTEVFIPGYFSGICNFAIYRELKNERLKSGCYNVFLVDWMWGNKLDLAVARLNMFVVAKQLAVVIKNIKDKYGLSRDMFILTGHSFGAHIAGISSQHERVGKIIGLDPAGGPITESTPLDERLDSEDADCVVVLHCNGGPCLPEYFALGFTCGTVDFWINGGSYQPSCYRQTLKNFFKQDYVYGIINLFPPVCFHFQCVQYYRASMNPKNCSFLGSQCSSYSNFESGNCKNCGKCGRNCLVMGIKTCDCLKRSQKNKSYYLDTMDDCPYCDNSNLKAGNYTCKAANIKKGVTSAASG